jgi:hypothetical protein
VADLNREVLSHISDAVEDFTADAGHGQGGRPLLLLTAPRAGYGKTHLIGRMAALTRGRVLALPLIFRPDDEISWQGVATEATNALRGMNADRPGWCRLREMSAGIFASLVAKLVQEGRLPCANQEQALRVLAADPKDLFIDGVSARAIGEWLRRNFSQLRKPLADAARPLMKTCNAEAWVDGLFAAAQHGSDASLNSLQQQIVGSRQSFLHWLALVSHWRPVVLFVDHLDGFYRHEQAGLKIATIVLDLAEMEAVHVVLSINQDLWQATFAHHLPSALEDRLTASQFLLRGLTAADGHDMASVRLREANVDPSVAGEFLNFLKPERYFGGRPVGSVSARAFLRHAAAQWDHYLALKARGENPLAEDPDDVPGEVESSAFSFTPTSDDAPPAIFPELDLAAIASAAAGLAEPRPAMVESPFSAVPLAANDGGASAPPSWPQAESRFPEPTPTSEPPAFSPAPFLDETPPEHEEAAHAGHHPAAPPRQPQAPGAMEKLREMMDQLRQQHPGPPPAPSVAPSSSGPEVGARLASLMGVETAATASATSSPTASAQERYEQLREQFVPEAQHQRLNTAKLADVVKLAGKRFPLVRYDELPLPCGPNGLVQRWTLPHSEVLFGLSDLQDLSYWRSLLDLAVRRASELAQGQSVNGSQLPQLKVVVCKGEQDTLSWISLLGGNAIPSEARPLLEPMHLDTHRLASLYASRQLIHEAGSGTLAVSPTHLMSIVTRELDFFWKRVTRAPGR